MKSKGRIWLLMGIWCLLFPQFVFTGDSVVVEDAEFQKLDKRQIEYLLEEKHYNIWLMLEDQEIVWSSRLYEWMKELW